ADAVLQEPLLAREAHRVPARAIGAMDSDRGVPYRAARLRSIADAFRARRGSCRKGGMSLRRTLLPLALGALIATGCERSAPTGSAPGASPGARAASAGAAGGKIVARYGDQVLTGEQLVVELQRLPERTRRTMNKDARRKFVDNYVLND